MFQFKTITTKNTDFQSKQIAFGATHAQFHSVFNVGIFCVLLLLNNHFARFVAHFHNIHASF